MGFKECCIILTFGSVACGLWLPYLIKKYKEPFKNKFDKPINIHFFLGLSYGIWTSTMISWICYIL